jgi:MFS family permease
MFVDVVYIVGAIELGDTIGTAVGPFFTGYLFDISGDYRIAFFLCSIVALIGLILILLLKPKMNNISN